MFPYRFGIEEEYFVVDRPTGDIRPEPSPGFMEKASRELGPCVMNELLQSQIEIVTRPFASPEEARQELAGLRTTLSRVASEFGLAIMAAGTHPLARPEQQRVTDSPRYRDVMRELGVVGLCSAACGLHVHVEIPDLSRRIEIMNRMMPFLPMFLALSTSSPFWSGMETGLLGYRSVANDASPRSGFPEMFESNEEYEDYVAALARAGAVRDSSHIWWVLRPSLRHPTLELRIMDCCTAVDDAVAIAGLYRALVRHLAHRRGLNAGLSAVARALAEENRWQAQRYGVDGTYIDVLTRQAKPFAQMLEETLEMVRDDLLELGHHSAAFRLRQIVRQGTSAHRQLVLYRRLSSVGVPHANALKEVSGWLAASTEAGYFIERQSGSVAA
jgi:carboxylate-amine ligase